MNGSSKSLPIKSKYLILLIFQVITIYCSAIHMLFFSFWQPAIHTLLLSVQWGHAFHWLISRHSRKYRPVQVINNQHSRGCRDRGAVEPSYPERALAPGPTWGAINGRPASAWSCSYVNGAGPGTWRFCIQHEALGSHANKAVGVQGAVREHKRRRGILIRS